MFQSIKPSVTIACRLKVAWNSFYRVYRLKIWMAGIALILILYTYVRVKVHTKTAKRVQQLVDAVLQILGEQDALNRRDPTIPSSISIHQIRDALFFKSNVKLRNKLWPLVCEEIGRNSNVRETVMSIKGEQHRVWEWVGSDVLAPLLRKFS